MASMKQLLSADTGEKNDRYIKVREDIVAAAKYHGVSTDMIEFKGDYPEEIDW